MSNSTPKKAAWKIAPGNRAEDWDVFRDNQCIGIGWLPDTKRPGHSYYDYSEFETVLDALAALEQRHGVGTPGYKKGGAEMIITFTQELKTGHIVVANDAYNDVVGIGIVTGDYLPPRHSDNPIRKDKSTHRHHVRMIDWLIKKRVNIPGGRFFAQRTVASLSAKQIEMIIAQYLLQYPNELKLTQQIKKIRARLSALNAL